MIQVSTPIESRNSSGMEPDAVPPEVRGDVKSRKKDKLGVFAALLDGLIGKPTRGKAGKHHAAAVSETEEGRLSLGVKNAKNGKAKGARDVPETGDPLNVLVLNGENSPQISALPEQAVTKQGLILKPELDPESADSAPQETGFPAAGADKSGDLPFSKGDVSGEDSIFRENHVREGELSLSGGAAEAGETGPASGVLLKGEYPETKTGGRGAVDLLPASARASEGRLYQFAGNPRPALVDSLSGVRSEETRESRLAEGRRKGRDRSGGGTKNLTPEGSREAGAGETVKSPGFDGGAEKADLEIRAEIRAEPGFRGREGSVDYGRPGNSQNRGLEEALVRELRENLGADIVKQASILVRSQQEGTIRLTLKPETLGNIKIRLEMAENKITGHIVVESSEALKAFERELPVLEKAFRDSGFSEASLDMSMTRNGEDYGREREDFWNLSPAQAASRYDAGIIERELVPEGFFPENQGKKAVNMLV